MTVMESTSNNNLTEVDPVDNNWGSITNLAGKLAKEIEEIPHSPKPTKDIVPDEQFITNGTGITSAEQYTNSIEMGQDGLPPPHIGADDNILNKEVEMEKPSISNTT